MDEQSDENALTEGAYQITDHLTIPVYADVQRYPCSNCGRAFNAESLRKHQPICQKTTQKKTKRKAFDMGKQRSKDSDVPYAATRETTKFYTEGVKPKSLVQKKSKNHWREDHQQLVQTIRQARRGSQTLETTPKKISIVNASPANSADYIQCEYCQRIFNPYSAERHIPFCQTQFKRKQMLLNNKNNSSQRSPVVPKFSRVQQSPTHQINSAPSGTPGKSFRRPVPPSTLKRTPPAQVNRPNRVTKPSTYLLGGAKHCHQCGRAFPVAWAKFCCECGEKRHGIE